MTGTAYIPIVVVSLATLVATVTDFRTLKVHNLLTLPLLLAGVFYHTFMGGMEGFAMSFAGAAFGFGGLVLLYLMGGMGAGDVKLAAALGAWLGVYLTAIIIAIGLLATAISSLVLLLQQGRLADCWINLKVSMMRLQVLARHFSLEDDHESVRETAQRPDARRRLIPFSAMIGVGVVVTLLWHVAAVYWFDR